MSGLQTTNAQAIVAASQYPGYPPSRKQEIWYYIH